MPRHHPEEPLSSPGMDVDPGGGDYRMMRDLHPRRELPPLSYGGPSEHPHDRGGYGGRGPPPPMDFGSDQEYSDRAAWEHRPRDTYYMEEEQHMRGPPPGPPLDPYRGYGPPEMREMREMPPDHPMMRGGDVRDSYPSPHRGQTMVHRDIL